MTTNKSGHRSAKIAWQRGLQFMQSGFFLPLLLLLVLAGCEGVPQGSQDSLQAVWDKESSTLSVSGITISSQENVEIHDASNGFLLGKAVVNGDGSWAASSTTPACIVHVDLPSGTATINVDNAPSDCTGSTLSGRVATENDIPAGVLVVTNPEPLNSIPNAIILSPPQDMTINAGQTVNFMGTAVGTSVTPPINYYWNFGGASPNSNIQNPGAIRFDFPGVYFIQLSVSDNLGIPDPTPAVRTIVVNGINSPVTTTPIPTISSPTAVNGSVTVSVGQSLFFSGSATDNLGSNSFTYEWDFSGIYPNQFGPTPGSIPFSRAGTYVVSLYATNPQGIRSAIPATVTVIVGGATGVNQAPVGAIVRPANDVVINVGESLNFRASGRDPDNNNPVYYSWDFQNVAPAIEMSTNSSGGTVTFNTPGIYYIRMTVTDSLGGVDPNPAVRIVTVQNSVSTTPPANGVLFSQITSPPSDVTIRPGQSVFFSGQAVGSNGTVPYQYFWNFDGGATNSNLQTPGSITFAFPGQFDVMFYATDISGNVVGTPATRTITVNDPSAVGSSILSPVDNSTVAVGTPVNLVGRVDNNTGFVNLTYDWSIRERGTRTDLYTSNQLSPGQYIFNQPGTYRIKFRVSGIDAFGNQTVASNSRVTITVTGNATTPVPGTPAPNNPVANGTGIASPATDMVVYAGNSVQFEATNFGNGVFYNWNFSGAASPSNQRRPAPVTFFTPGTFFVTLQISGNSNGIPINVFDQRVVTVLQQQTSPFPPVTNPIANGSGIQSPAADMVINPGTNVNFRANNFGNGATYNWDFGGAASPSFQRNPPAVQFFSPGTYLVTLRVTGTSNGVPISIFDQRAITVLQQNQTFPPIGSPGTTGTGIQSPTTDMTINVGTSVDFRANNFGNGANYSWDFGGAALPSNRRNPPAVQFFNPGTYRVTLQITGTSNGVPISMFDQRIITVGQGFGTPPTNPFPFNPPVTGASGPEGYIVSPSSSLQQIRVGQSLLFSGSGFDPVGSGPLTFQWSFGGASRNIDSQNPGSITFNRVGTYVVTLLVKNAFGQFDMTPAYVVVDVTP